MAASVDDAALERLLRVFAQRDESGARVFSDDEVRAFVPLLVLGAKGEVDLSGALGDVMRAFAAQLGVTAETPPDDAERRVAEHLAKHPPSPRLLAEVKGVLREELVTGGKLDAKAAAKALGSAVAKTPVGHGEAPEGSTKASPLTRFSLQKKNDDEG